MSIIVWGAFLAFLGFISHEIKRFSGSSKVINIGNLRHDFGVYLLLGLEFLIAADIIQTISNPNLEGLMVLGSIVVIRTVISVFLNRECAVSN